MEAVDHGALSTRFPLLRAHDWSSNFCELHGNFFEDDEVASRCSDGNTAGLHPMLSVLCLIQLFVVASLVVMRALGGRRFHGFLLVATFFIVHFGWWKTTDWRLREASPPAIASATVTRSYVDSWEPLISLMWEHAHGQKIQDTFVKHDSGEIVSGPLHLPKCQSKQAQAKLPKIMHQFDTRGYEGLPETRQKAVRLWKESLHPHGIKHFFWDEPALVGILEKEFPLLLDVYRRLKQPVARADMARYFLLYRFGGLYSDTDRVPALQTRKTHVVNELLTHNQGSVAMSVTSIENFAGPHAAYMSFLHGIMRYNIDLMASAPGHPYMLRVLANIYYQMADTQPVGWALGDVSRFFFRAGPEAASRLLSRHLEVVQCADFDHRIIVDVDFNATVVLDETPVPLAQSTMDLGGWVNPADQLFLLNLCLVLINSLGGHVLNNIPTLTLLAYELTFCFWIFVVPIQFAKWLANHWRRRMASFERKGKKS